MGRLNRDVRDSWDLVQLLFKCSKVATQAIIRLTPKQSNVHWWSGGTSVTQDKTDDPLALTVEKSRRDAKYGIKLASESIGAEPFFRFDSDGPAHRNDDPSIPLPNQVITTPHFNTFDESGRSIAYKTVVLADENEARAIAGDTNFGLAHFCDEASIRTAAGQHPQVAHVEGQIDFGTGPNDPLEGLSFT